MKLSNFLSEYFRRFTGACRGFQFLGIGWLIPFLAYLSHPLLRRILCGRTISIQGYRGTIGTSDLFVLGQLFREYPIGTVRANLENCDLVIDAGANVGAFCWLLRRLAPGLSVIALEPEERNFTSLSAQPFLGKVKVLRAAIGSQSGTARLEQGVSAASHRVTMDAAIGPEVKMVTLAEICGDAKRAFLKLDIEGGERDLLAAGIPSVIKYIVMEWHYPESPLGLLAHGRWTHWGGNSYSWASKEMDAD